LIVVVASTEMAALYSVDDGVGSEPSIVYRIADPDTAFVKVADCVTKYVPAAGVMLTFGRFIVYVAEAMLLAGMPDAHAFDFSVRL